MTCFIPFLYMWYGQKKRNFPWRMTTDTYFVWVSEVMLQQTQAVKVLDYFVRFTERFPDVQSLALASEDEVMRLWQGLGYYGRARNLHLAAKIVVNDYGGVFPVNYSAIRALPGVGDYTAAAICSFCFGMPTAVVDGNVFRFLSRFFGVSTPIDTSIGRKEFFKLANMLIDKENPYLFNQAMMEFGSIQCTPASPNCVDCPLVHMCVAFSQGTVSKLPVKSKKIEKRVRFFNFFVVLDPLGNTLIMRRDGKDIWQGLYQFPLLESEAHLTIEDAVRHAMSRYGSEKVVLSAKRKHLLTHQDLVASFWLVSSEFIEPSEGEILVSFSDLSNFAMPQLLVLFAEALGSVQ